eukprot:13799708-Heterocapsa_arctica.AAC.1
MEEGEEESALESSESEEDPLASASEDEQEAEVKALPLDSGVDDAMVNYNAAVAAQLRLAATIDSNTA